MRAALALALFTLAANSAVPAVEPAQSATVLGPSNALLAEGAEALEAGRIEEGIAKTLEGLSGPASPRDTAAGYCNLCAGYAALKRWDEALRHCNTSLELDPTNWRTYNNRAAIHAGRGEFELALRDLESGFAIAPASVTLKRSLQIVEANRRLAEERGRASIGS